MLPTLWWFHCCTRIWTMALTSWKQYQRWTRRSDHQSRRWPSHMNCCLIITITSVLVCRRCRPFLPPAEMQYFLIAVSLRSKWRPESTPHAHLSSCRIYPHCRLLPASETRLRKTYSVKGMVISIQLHSGLPRLRCNSTSWCLTKSCDNFSGLAGHRRTRSFSWLMRYCPRLFQN